MDELSATAREILSEMRKGDAPHRGARERVRRQLAMSLASTASATAVAGKSAAAMASSSVGSAASVSAAKLALLVVIGAASGTVALTPVALLTEPPSRAVRHEVARTPATKPIERREPPQAAPLSRETAPPPEPAQSAAPANQSVGRTPALPIDSPRASSLASETRLLTEARELMRGGNAADALALLDRYARLYPNGALREEVAASRVFSLAALGRIGEANTERLRFHTRFPRSPLGPRVDGAVSP
jgi:hypothetical protein